MPPAKHRAVAQMERRKGTLKQCMAKVRAARQNEKAKPITSDIDGTSTSPAVNNPSSASTPRLSASRRKLDYFSSATVAQSSPSSLPTIITDLNLVASLFEGLLCRACKQPGLILQEGSGMRAFSIHLKVLCPHCETINSEGYISPKTSQSHEGNRKVAAAGLTAGSGHAHLSKFCEGLGVRSMQLQPFHMHTNAIFEISKDVAHGFLQQAREVVVTYYRLNRPEAFSEDGMLNLAVSFDGSWPKRGHTSKLGCGAVIDLMTGLVIDFHVMSLYCQLCTATGETLNLKARNDQIYNDWLQQHKAQGWCTQKCMEVAGVFEIWGRSTIHGMRYTTLLGDGDTKTYQALCRAKPYGDIEIVKEECVNHVGQQNGPPKYSCTCILFVSFRHPSFTTNFKNIMARRKCKCLNSSSSWAKN